MKTLQKIAITNLVFDVAIGSLLLGKFIPDAAFPIPVVMLGAVGLITLILLFSEILDN